MFLKRPKLKFNQHFSKVIGKQEDFALFDNLNFNSENYKRIV